MPNVDTYEREILTAFEKSSLKSVATKAELEKFRAAARATAVKDKRVKSEATTSRSSSPGRKRAAS